MSMLRWEMEYYEDGEWRKVGLPAKGGFMPYRYEFEADAEQTLRRLHPTDPRRVVRAESVIWEPGYG